MNADTNDRTAGNCGGRFCGIAENSKREFEDPSAWWHNEQSDTNEAWKIDAK